MGMRDKPDVFGLPIYRPNRFFKERVGNEVRMVCGIEAFGQINWTHVTILDITDMAILTAESEAMDPLTIFMPEVVKRSAGH